MRKRECEVRFESQTGDIIKDIITIRQFLKFDTIFIIHKSHQSKSIIIEKGVNFFETMNLYKIK